MALPPNAPTFKNLYLQAATSSTAGAEIKVVVPCRARYVSTLLSVWGTTAGGTSGLDVFAYQGGFGGGTSSPTITIISSGSSITTSSGNVSFEYVSTGTFVFNKGDIIGVSGSTGISGVTGYSVVHTFQEL